VIIGGGFGGLYAARGLGSAPVRVTLIDRRNYHLFRPMYQVATGLLSADEIAGPLRSILRRRNVDVLLEEVIGVDVHARVHLRRYDQPYDFLILATGLQYNYFGHMTSGSRSLPDWRRWRTPTRSAARSCWLLSARRNLPPSVMPHRKRSSSC
jgi:NADH dehydrogenase FAD-containing subunit